MVGRSTAKWIAVGIPTLGLSLAFLVGSARAAATFTVTSAADPGDGSCATSGCTLREAIAAANSSPGADTIEFEIPGAGVHTIEPASALPTITRVFTTAPDTFVRMDFYLSPKTRGPGKKHLGFSLGSSDETGRFSVVFLPSSPLTVGRVVTATASTTTDGTSEFSAPKEVVE